MNNILEKYFGASLSIEEQTYNFMTFFCIIGYSLSLCFDIILSRSTVLIISHVIALFIGIALFVFHDLLKENLIFIRIIILCYSFIAFPLGYLINPNLVSELPVYFLIGMVFTSMILKGRYLILCLSGEVAVYCISIYYVLFIHFKDVSVQSIKITSIDYITISVAIVMSGIMCGVLLHFRNKSLIYEMKQNENAKEEAKDIDFAKDMFLVNVSHDIRTPLQAIIGTSEIILDANKDDHIIRNVHYIANSGRALLSITNDLLDFSKMREDNIVISTDEYRFSTILDDITNMISVRLSDTNVNFYTTINPNIPDRLRGDEEKVRQIMINVLSNAVKYTIAGSIELTIDFEEKSENTVMIKMTVADTGIGMDEDTINRLFEPFVKITAENETENEGYENYGLGLSLCRKILEKMNGDIRVNSVYGKGSTFFFQYEQQIGRAEKMVSVHADGKNALVFEKTYDDRRAFENIMVYFGIKCVFPDSKQSFLSDFRENEYTHIFIAQENLVVFSPEELNEIYEKEIILMVDSSKTNYEDRAKFICSRPANCLNVGAIFNGEYNYSIRSVVNTGEFISPQSRMLVVDDNLINVEVATGLLGRYQGSIMSANSGMQCLNILERENFDIIFLDYMMPEMDGIDTLKKIREMQDEKKRNTPVVALTANAVSGAKEMFINAGFDEYISKPIVIEHLEDVVRKLLPKNKIILKK